MPEVVGRVEIPEETGTGTGPTSYIEDLAGLVAMVQMGVLEIHPWGSTVDKLETPDRITFDFDPDVGLPWERVIEAAVEMREALIGIGLQSFAKTTGGKGLHVVVPMAPKLGWDAVKEFAQWVAEQFVAAYPDRFTDQHGEARPRRPHLYRLPAQRPRRHRDRRLFAARPGRRAGRDAAVLGGGRKRRQARRLHRRDRARPPRQARIRPLGRDAETPPIDQPRYAAKWGFEEAVSPLFSRRAGERSVTRGGRRGGRIARRSSALPARKGAHCLPRSRNSRPALTIGTPP